MTKLILENLLKMTKPMPKILLKMTKVYVLIL